MDIYREEILEHWRNPQNFGEMAGADVVIDQINPLCGDQVTFFFKLKNGKIEKVSFIGLGCAISIASASILSDFIKGKSIGDLSQITGKRVLDLIGGGITPAR
ncbi:iron-sulfur cluster assembly scaffold protein, partial [Candidatus Curtissbacteria bacterium]|nr:iron-sulfur cluster assembly scaffold protein [Candidatus Curtissbacteria bacterium]